MIQGKYASHGPRHYRSIFLSDFHMGAKSFDAAALLDFLKSTSCDYLYLAGDIIDGWKLKKRWYWTEDCNRVIDELVRKSNEGTKIIYLPGNHDDEVRAFLPFSRGRFAKKLGIKIKDKAIHTLNDGRQFLVMHGDQFDNKILRGAISRWSDRVYDFFSDLLGTYKHPTINIKGQRKPFSLAKALKKHGKWALILLNNFENAVYKTVQNKEVDGLICGHTHVPVIKSIQEITYANAGSWVGHRHTALVENHDGKLELLDWPPSTEAPSLFDPLLPREPHMCKIVPDSSCYRPATQIIVRRIRHKWPVEEKAPSSQKAPALILDRLHFPKLHKLLQSSYTP